MEIALLDAIARTSVAAIGRVCNISPQAVSQWRVVPPQHVLRVASLVAFEITPHQLRPDLYPHPSDGLPPDRRCACE